MCSSLLKRVVIGLSVLLLATACSKPVSPKKEEHPPLGHMEHGNMEMSAFEDASWSVRDESITGSLVFTILKDGQEWTKFDVRHEKKLHLIIVRSDLTQFQHLHPVMKKDGTWTIPFTPLEDGTYWIFADFRATNEGDHVVRFDRVYGLPTKEAYVPEIYEIGNDGSKNFVTKRIDEREFTVSVTALTPESGSSYRMSWSIISPFGDDIPVESYLGANGHSVWISPKGDYIHTHPLEDYSGFKKGDAPAFMISNPRDSRYRTFTQVQIKGKLYTIFVDWPLRFSR